MMMKGKKKKMEMMRKEISPRNHKRKRKRHSIELADDFINSTAKDMIRERALAYFTLIPFNCSGTLDKDSESDSDSDSDLDSDAKNSSAKKEEVIVCCFR